MANEQNGLDATSIDWSFAAEQAFLPPRTPLFANVRPGTLDNNSFYSSWPRVPHASASVTNRRHHQRTPSTSFLPQTPSWVDDLLNDTDDVPLPKSLHRRSSSDSLAHLETPLRDVRIHDITEEEELGSSSNLHMHMLPEGWNGLSHASPSNANIRASSAEDKVPFETSSCLSDHDSVNASLLEVKRTKGVEQSKNDTEVQSVLNLEHSTLPATGKDESLPSADASMDPKRAKRILANRQSAQRSRVRKLQYIAELERTVNALQEEVSALSPQVTYLEHHRIMLNVDNSAMKQRIAALAQEKLFKDAHNDALKSEVQRLRQLYQQQQQKQAAQPNQTGQAQLHFQVTSQLDLKGVDGVFDVAKYVLKESEDDLLDSHAPPRSPLLKPIGPSSCSNAGKKNKGILADNMPGLEQLHSDFRVQNS